jgi:hypothetical protein
MELTSVCLKSLIEDCVSYLFVQSQNIPNMRRWFNKEGLWSGMFNALFASWLKYSPTPYKVHYYIALCTVQCIMVVMVVFAIKIWFYFISNFEIRWYVICKISKIHKSKIFLNGI